MFRSNGVIGSYLHPRAMIKNFFKTAFRNMLKYKAYSLINFIGLTCGLTLALLIITYVRHELSYDRFHAHADRIYRMRYTAPNGLEIASSPPPIAPVMKDYFPEIEEVARVFGRNVSITKPDSPEAFEESGIFFADSAFAKIFTLEFIKGKVRNPLHEKFTVLLNEEMAKKYFGDENPVGESLLFAGKSFKVTGVVKDFPENSHLRFNMLVPYDNMYDLETDQTAERIKRNFEINFIISHSYTYVMLKPGSTPDHINANMGEFLKKY
ncbi:MAG TPA: ABC transporter permease, partial [Cyclobacteriaceae bacterium]|nr:ABC transporter permease [Cyclobacteriaceae bacterium]